MSVVNFSTCYLYERRNFSFDGFESYKEDMRLQYIDYLALGLPWLKVLIVLFGIATNVLNIVVLTRPYLSSSINIQFVALECVNLAWYTTFFQEFAMFYNKDLVIEFSEVSCLIRVISLCLHETCVCASNWLTVSVGVWRFLAISFPFKAVTYCSKYRSKVVVSVIILLSIVLWTLYYISFECYLMIYDLTDDSGEVHEVVVRFTHNRRKTKEPSYSRVHHPIRILTTTAVPCTILIVVSVALIVRLWMARRARGAMTNERVTSVSQETEENNVIERRVTLVLTAMIMMNFFTYLPVNVIYVFYQETNLPIIISRLSWSRYLVLICNCLTICFYCFMSTKLRQTYARFLSLPFSRWNPVKVKSHSSTSIRSTVSETSIL